jgi:hypothetical protein
MIGGSERLLEVRRTVFANCQKTVGKATNFHRVHGAGVGTSEH